MLTVKRTTSDNADFQQLVSQLDKYLHVMDGEEHAFYAQYNKIDSLKNVVVCYEDMSPLACGAFKEFAPGTVEIKRMYVVPESRGKGIAAIILKELENWAATLHYTKAVLETGKRQVEAVRLYQKSGYSVIPNYGQYEQVENSICMQKVLV